MNNMYKENNCNEPGGGGGQGQGHTRNEQTQSVDGIPGKKKSELSPSFKLALN